MATPFDLEMIHSGIDEVMKIQTDKGKIRLFEIAPQIDSSEGFRTVQRISGFRDPRNYGRGESIETDRKQKLDRTDYYPLLFAKRWQTYDYDRDEDVYKEMASNMADVAIAMLRRKDKEEKNLLNNGFDATNFPIVDGASLFSTSHTGVTGVASQANRPASGSGLDPISVEAMITRMMSQTDFNGEQLYWDGKLNIWTGNTLFPLLYRIVEAEYQATTPDNDPNFVNTYVTARRGVQISSTAAFYGIVSDSQNHKLRCIQFSPFRTLKREQGTALETDYFAYERYRFIPETWQGVDANPGP